MPFCRKCGRRLVELSESCPECGTSTTAPLIKIKKASGAHPVRALASKKIAKAIIPAEPIVISVKVIAPEKAVKAVVVAKEAKPAKSIVPAKPIVAAVVSLPHEIIKSNISLKKDITQNPQDYETQTFDFDLICPNGHFWPEGAKVLVSNGIGFCLRCGERLRKPETKKSRRQRRAKFP
jgi:hypothetical protein